MLIVILVHENNHIEFRIKAIIPPPRKKTKLHSNTHSKEYKNQTMKTWSYPDYMRTTLPLILKHRGHIGVYQSLLKITLQTRQ